MFNYYTRCAPAFVYKSNGVYVDACITLVKYAFLYFYSSLKIYDSKACLTITELRVKKRERVFLYLNYDFKAFGNLTSKSAW